LTGSFYVKGVARATGGNGGSGYGTPSAGASASASSSATSTTTKNYNADGFAYATGGNGGSDYNVAGNGGAGGAATSAKGTATELTAKGGGRAYAQAHELGGAGGRGYGAGKSGGAGGTVAATSASATGYSAVATTVQTGGAGGYGASGAAGGAGASSTLTNSVTGTAAAGGYITLNQTAIGGNGGNSSGAAGGAAGAATSSLTFDDLTANEVQAATLTGVSTATGGAGGSGNTAGIAGGAASSTLILTGLGTVKGTANANGGTASGTAAGGSATANATATETGQIGAATAIANAKGGTGSTLGAATASATAVSAFGNVATANATASNTSSDSVQTSATSKSNGAVIQDSATTQTSLGTGDTAESSANIGGNVPTLLTTTYNNWSFVTGLPNASSYSSELSANSNVNAKLGAAGALVLGAGSQGSFYNGTGSQTYKTSTSFTLNASKLSGSLIAGFTGFTSEGSGFSTMTLTITVGGTQVVAQTFTTLAAADAYFSNDAINLGTVPNSSSLTVVFSLSMTETTAGSGFGEQFLLGTTAGNGPPTITAPASFSLVQGKTSAIAGVSLAELGGTSTETYTVTLTDSNGLLSATGSGISGSGTTKLVITGTLNQVNADLATLSDIENTAVASDTIAISATDSIGGTAVVTDIAVTNKGIPTFAGPATDVLGIGIDTAISGVSLTEVNSQPNETFTATLTDAHGLLSATGSGVSGSGTTTLTITGTLAQVNADLATLKDTNATAGADSIHLTATDSLGVTGPASTIAVTVNGVPVIAAPATATVSGATTISGISLSESGDTTSETFTVKVSDSKGLLSATGSGITGSGTTSLTITGSLAQVNADLATLSDSDGSPPSDTLTITATDSLGNSAVPDTVAITVKQVSLTPVITAPAAVTIGAGHATTISGLSLAETGNTNGETFTVTLTDANGLLSDSGTGVSGSGTKTLTLTGSLAQVNALLATVTDTNATAGTDTITLNATDSFGNTAAPASVAVTVNGLPVTTAPKVAVVTAGTATAVSGISIAETGTTTGETFTVKLTDANGLLSATGTGITGAGTKALTITGTLAQVNADLATLTVNDSVVAADTISISTSDSLGNTGTTATTTVQFVGTTYTLTAAPRTIAGTYANDTIVATNATLISPDHIDGGGGANSLTLSGGGTFDLGAPATLANIQTVSASEGQAPTSGSSPTGIQTIYMRSGLNVTLNVASGTPAGGNSNPETITIYGASDSSTFNLGKGTDNVVLGSAAETVNASATGTALIQGLSTQAGALITGNTQATTQLEITDSGGTATLNAADTQLTVKLDGATNLTLSKMGFITADGSVGGSTLTALAANQTLLGGVGDTLVGASVFGDLFKGTSILMNGDSIKNFGGTDLIDLTDINESKVTGLSYTPGSGSGVLTVTDGTHSASLTMIGTYTKADFGFKTDGATGTLVTFV
jgi:hypothetical protein